MANLILLFALFFSSSIHAQSELRYFGDGIRDASTPWSKSFQGMCHDEDHYFIVQRYYLWKIPRTLSIEKVTKKSLKKGVSKVGIPQRLKDRGANHMGDCDAHQGLVIVPLEGTWPQKLLIFDANSLALLGDPDLPKEQPDAPWVTVDPDDGSIVTGTFMIGPERTLFRHRLSADHKTLIPMGKIQLRNQSGESIELKRVQGVDIVRSRNLLWVVSDTPEGGLYGFDLTTGLLTHHRKISYLPKFPQFEELEGLDTLEDHEVPFAQYRGNLFVTMLNNNILFRSTGYLKLFEY